MSDVCSDPSILYVCEQRRLWWDCADTQARLSLRWSPIISWAGSFALMHTNIWSRLGRFGIQFSILKLHRPNDAPIKNEINRIPNTKQRNLYHTYIGESGVPAQWKSGLLFQKILLELLRFILKLLDQVFSMNIFSLRRSCACGPFRYFPFVQIVFRRVRLYCFNTTRTGCSWAEVVLDNIWLCMLIRVFYEYFNEWALFLF